MKINEQFPVFFGIISNHPAANKRGGRQWEKKTVERKNGIGKYVNNGKDIYTEYPNTHTHNLPHTFPFSPTDKD